jgi:hypothetical protein
MRAKVKHLKKDFALIALRVFIRQHRPTDYYQVYDCKNCGGYHIGRPKQKVKFRFE